MLTRQQDHVTQPPNCRSCVCQCLDPVHQRDVALKILPRIDPVSLSRFKREFRVLAEVDNQNAWMSPRLPWLATTLHRQLQDSTEQSQAQSRQQLKRAARQGLTVARKFQTDLPHALREAGLIAAMQGSGRRARKFLDESLDVAERQDAKFEHAQSLLARG